MIIIILIYLLVIILFAIFILYIIFRKTTKDISPKPFIDINTDSVCNSNDVSNIFSLYDISNPTVSILTKSIYANDCCLDPLPLSSFMTNTTTTIPDIKNLITSNKFNSSCLFICLLGNLNVSTVLNNNGSNIFTVTGSNIYKGNNFVVVIPNNGEIQPFTMYVYDNVSKKTQTYNNVTKTSVTIDETGNYYINNSNISLPGFLFIGPGLFSIPNNTSCNTNIPDPDVNIQTFPNYNEDMSISISDLNSLLANSSGQGRNLIDVNIPDTFTWKRSMHIGEPINQGQTQMCLYINVCTMLADRYSIDNNILSFNLSPVFLLVLALFKYNFITSIIGGLNIVQCLHLIESDYCKLDNCWPFNQYKYYFDLSVKTGKQYAVQYLNNEVYSRINTCCYDSCNLDVPAISNDDYMKKYLSRNTKFYTDMSSIKVYGNIQKTIDELNDNDIITIINEIKVGLLKGPILSSFSITPSFKDYSSKCLNNPDLIFINTDDTQKTKLNGHAITIIGWGKIGGIEYWDIKDSYGLQRCGTGYFKIAMSSSIPDRTRWNYIDIGYFNKDLNSYSALPFSIDLKKLDNHQELVDNGIFVSADCNNGTFQNGKCVCNFPNFDKNCKNCLPGFYGSKCDKTIADCSNNGIPTDQGCICNPHYSGANCNTECSGNGVVKNGVRVCGTPGILTDDPWRGSECQYNNWSTCSNHGVVNDSGFCTCYPGQLSSDNATRNDCACRDGLLNDGTYNLSSGATCQSEHPGCVNQCCNRQDRYCNDACTFFTRSEDCYNKCKQDRGC